MHPTNCFITLTYDEEHLSEGHTLVKSDLQNFYKRLRKKGFKFRYFSAGEYGETTNRPHYHAVLFGIDFINDRKRFKETPQGHTLYTSETLTKTWGLGHCLIGHFSYQTAAYTARYVLKKVGGKHAPDHYTRVNPCTGELTQALPEFALMSSRPGIGRTWYEKFHTDAFPSDFLVHEGKKHTVPRYYFDQLKRTNESLHNEIKQKRVIAREKNSADSTADRLYVREECKLSRLSQLKRSL